MRIFQVDAFTDRPFSGNPAAVCIMSEPHGEVWMQAVTGEMNLSETAFLLKRSDGFSLRWFTPKIEVALCGHATLASAHILWEEGFLEKRQEARFHTLSGLLTASRRDDWIELDFPSEPEQESNYPDELISALGIAPKYVGKNRFDYLLEIESEQALVDMHPDFSLLEKIPARGVIVTSTSGSEEYDFVSRFFAPRVGINEDPVTGSAHCCLGPFWEKRLGKNNMLAYQASERGGALRLRVTENRVYIGGQAVTVFRGELLPDR